LTRGSGIPGHRRQINTALISIDTATNAPAALAHQGSAMNRSIVAIRTGNSQRTLQAT
jgi:hypothetical protein